MGQKTRVLIDSYAIIADLSGQISEKARQILDDVRLGRIEGLIHYLIVYELYYHWRRGRLPFESESELKEFLDTYFSSYDLDPDIASKASRIKIEGDKLLESSKDPRLSRRRLSVSDSTTIAVALVNKAPVITGDEDLMYVAKKLGIEVLW